jgi:hypothetical protein
VVDVEVPESGEEYLLVLVSQSIVFPSVSYVRNLITKAGVKQVKPFNC